jgi:Domain of unknown function (DUF4292)
MKLRSYTVILFFLALAASSCRGPKKIQTAITRKDTTEVVVVVNNNTAHDDSMRFIQSMRDTILRQKIEYTTFNAKVDVDYTGGDGKKYNVNANIRMYKDSLIWVSVNAILGIEAMRLLITKDSVKLINKLDKFYSVRSVSSLQEITALPLDLSTFQELIIGNPVYLDSNIVSYSKNGEEVSLLSLGSVFRHFITIHANEKVVQHSKMDDVDVLRNRTCDLIYEKYEDKKGPRFSTRRQITVSETSKLDVKLDFKNYDFNETLSFPFNVPKNYERK